MFLYRVQVFLVFVFCCAADNETPSAISVVIHKTLAATARGCMTKTNATESDLEYLRKEPPYPETTACILKCLLEKIHIVKNNKFSKNGFIAAVSPLVLRNKKKMEHMKNVAENCDKEINHGTSTPCQSANEVVICVFKYAPELHFKSR